MIAIVCGGRDYTDAARVGSVLDAAVTRLRLDTIIEGGNGERDQDGKVRRGADLLALEWAKQRGDISIIHVPAEWDRHGDAAGPIRNRLMFAILLGGGSGVERGIIAFPGGTGTQNMVDLGRSPKGRQMDVRIHEIDRKPDKSG